jgi:ribosomal-protein-serine acetyltransferase
MLRHAFNTWKLNRVVIECATENTRSRGVPERLGFKLEGVTRQGEWLHDHYVDHAIYSQLSREFAGRYRNVAVIANRTCLCAVAA